MQDTRSKSNKQEEASSKKQTEEKKKEKEREKERAISIRSISFLGITDDAVMSIARSSRHQLRRAYLSACKLLTDQTLLSLASHCLNLEVLYLNGCSRFTDVALTKVRKKKEKRE